MPLNPYADGRPFPGGDLTHRVTELEAQRAILTKAVDELQSANRAHVRSLEALQAELRSSNPQTPGMLQLVPKLWKRVENLETNDLALQQKVNRHWHTPTGNVARDKHGITILRPEYTRESVGSFTTPLTELQAAARGYVYSSTENNLEVLKNAARAFAAETDKTP